MFWPIPPNSIFTTIIAKTPPITGTHHAILGGILRAKIKPVTTALKSNMVIGDFVIIYFLLGQEATEATVTQRALSPKCTIPKIMVGASAMQTSIIIFWVLLLSLIWGETEILYTISPPFSLYLL